MFCGIFTYFFVLIAPNLVYLQYLDTNKVGSWLKMQLSLLLYCFVGECSSVLAFSV